MEPLQPSTALDEYLRGPFRSEQRELREIRDLAEEVLPIFSSFYVQRRDGRCEWPYVVRAGTIPEERERSRYSQSTNAMILFALGAVMGATRAAKSALTPLRGRPLLSGESGVFRKIEHVRTLGLTTLVEELRPTGFETSSSTFGANDPFTVGWILELSATEGGEQLKPIAAIARRLVERVFAAPGDPILQLSDSGRQETDHAFPALRTTHVWRCLKQQDHAVNALSTARMAAYFTDRLHRNLSLSYVSDGAFDPADLAFSLEGALLTAGKEVDLKTARKALAILDEGQERAVYWQPLRPFIAKPNGMTLCPLSVEIASSLLRVTAFLEDELGEAECFSRVQRMFGRYARWISSRVRRGTTANEMAFVGWHSEHINAPGLVHLWETSQVLVFLTQYAAMLGTRHIAVQCLELSRLKVRLPEPTQWEDTVAKYEPLPEARDGSPYRVYGVLHDAFVKTEAADQLRSALLFGPPGTGKTTIATNLANALGRRLVEISLSDFTSDGKERLESRAKSLFEVLEQQSDVVILFDEIDHLLLDRESRMYSDLGDTLQLITPGLLTKFAGLWKAKGHPIFLVATNFAERIDPAIKRGGRIDRHILVLPPSLERRRQMFHKRLGQEARDDQLDDLARLTPLWTSVEIEALMRRALGNRQAALESARAFALQEHPQIRLHAYRSRFASTAQRGSELYANSQPYEEFFLLVWLIKQARELNPDEREMFEQLRAEVALEEYVRDEDIREVLG